MNIRLENLLDLVDEDQKINIYYRDKPLWSGNRSAMKDLILLKCPVGSIIVEKTAYPTLEIYLLQKGI